GWRPGEGNRMSTKLFPFTATPSHGQATLDIPRPPQSEPAHVLAALARVVGVLAGEADVTIGTVTAATRDVTWRELVADVARQSNGGTVFDVGATLGVEVLESCLRLEYSLQAVDRAYAERIGGYLLRATEAALSTPDSPVEELDLLSAQERHQLLHERAGEARELPQERFHELFARRAAQHPERVAIVHSGQSYSYGWLDATANRVAHSLLAQGVRPEDVVMTLTERTPQWLAALIGIFNAGCAYLPAEPDFPQARIDTLREQSGCRIVLTASDLSNLDAYPDTDPRVPVG